jgi:GT2 family glycosyltransferase
MGNRVSVKEVSGFIIFESADCAVVGNIHELLESGHLLANADFVYGDSAHQVNLTQFSYQIRPEWSPERLRSHCYVGGVVAASPSLVEKAGGTHFLRELSSHDRALRLSEIAENPVHLDAILYCSPIDRSFPTADLAAVRSHCERMNIDAECSLSDNGDVVSVIRRLSQEPRVCVIIPTRGDSAEVFGTSRNLAANAIRTFREKSTYRNFEIVAVIDSVASAESRLEIIEAGGDDLTILDYDSPFNFAEKINAASVYTDAEYLLFMNDDTEIYSPEVISVLLSYFEDQEIGLVAPLLVFEDGSIQSAGHLLNPVPFDLYRGYAPESRGGFNIVRVAREVSSVIAAFSMTPTKLFLEVGGMSTKFPSDYNDVDYALKIQRTGRKVIYTPYAKCWHFESKTRKPGFDSSAIELLGARWKDVIENDPYGNSKLQRYEFVWKTNIEDQFSLADAVGEGAVWNGNEWRQLQALPDRDLHRTMFFPWKIWWKK